MIEAVLVVLTKAKAGRDDDLNDWYTNIHLRDALRFRGSISAQRFVRADSQVQDLPADFNWRYLALYDVSDPARFSQEHWENALGPRMMVSNAIDDSVLEDYHYYPVQFRTNDPGAPHRSGVILEQINADPEHEAEFCDWYNDTYLPRALRRPGVHSAAFLTFRDHGQMIPTKPRHRHVGIYRVNTPEAVAAWRTASDVRHAECVDAATLRITHWDKLTERITKDQVLHTDAASLAAEERARAHMGDNVMTGGKEKLSLA